MTPIEKFASGAISAAVAIVKVGAYYLGAVLWGLLIIESPVVGFVIGAIVLICGFGAMDSPT